jgi:predicted acyl esterase
LDCPRAVACAFLTAFGVTGPAGDGDRSWDAVGRPSLAVWAAIHQVSLAGIVAVLLLSLALFVGAVGRVGSERAMYPEPKVEDHALDEYQFAAVTEDVRFPSLDGTPLAGWFVPASGERAPMVTLLHGYGRSRADLLPHAAYLDRAAFTVLLFDFRGSGESGGGAVTIGAMAMHDDPRIVAIVADGRFSDSRGLIGSAYENLLNLPSFPWAVDTALPQPINASLPRPRARRGRRRGQAPAGR